MDAAREEGRRDGARASIRGAPPDLQQLPPGCAFAPRCDYVRPLSEAAPPPLRPFGTIAAACVLEDSERPWLHQAEAYGTVVDA
jgi:peptide/nickel transport system ATP-binding protein